MNLEVKLWISKKGRVLFFVVESSSNFPEKEKEFPPVLMQLRVLLSQLVLTVSHLKSSF